MTMVYAHRGASAAEPENTLAAFTAAVAMGADGVELDVRRTADGALAVHHDAHLVDGRPLVEVVSTDLPAGVALLEAALDACDGVVVNVEVKNFPGEPDFDDGQAVAEAVAHLVGERDLHRHVIVSSFNLAAIDCVRKVDVGVPTGYLVLLAPHTEAAGPLVEKTRAGGHSALHPHHIGVTADLVRGCAGAGLALNAWTVDDPGRIAELGDLGVDGIVTNVPDVALRALGR